MSTPSTTRRGLRVGAVAASAGSVLLTPPALAGTPNTWADPPPVSVMHTLLVFVGIPLAIILGITLLVLAPSLIRGDRQQRGVSWTEPQWFGGPSDALPAGRHATHGELGRGTQAEDAGKAEQPGGASARW